jgi:hypothetical protein
MIPSSLASYFAMPVMMRPGQNSLALSSYLDFCVQEMRITESSLTRAVTVTSCFKSRLDRDQLPARPGPPDYSVSLRERKLAIETRTGITGLSPLEVPR